MGHASSSSASSFSAPSFRYAWAMLMVICTSKQSSGTGDNGLQTKQTRFPGRHQPLQSTSYIRLVQIKFKENVPRMTIVSFLGGISLFFLCRGTFWKGILTLAVILRENAPDLNYHNCASLVHWLHANVFHLLTVLLYSYFNYSQLTNTFFIHARANMCL